jgi:hypothetical protein
VCVSSGWVAPTRAQTAPLAPAHPQPSAPSSEAPIAAGGDIADAAALERALADLRGSLEQARFEHARARAEALLAAENLSARQRNDTLELLAVAQIAARDEAGARETLRQLFARDPQHPERLRDPGPTVSAAFARAHAEATAPTVPTLASVAATALSGRPRLAIELGSGRDAIDSVHVFTRSAPELEAAHLVADVGTQSALVLALPAGASAALPTWLELYVEARAPSGFVLARAGTNDAPLRFALPPTAPPCVAPAATPPLRRSWWLWTSIAIAVAGIGVSGAIVAQ